VNAISPTDRDSYRIKRIHSAGDNYAKAFKTFFNQTIVMPIKQRMYKEFSGNSFSKVKLAEMFKNAIMTDKFEKLIVQTIVSGNKANLKLSKRTNITNRLFTQFLNRKNQLSAICCLRQIIANASDSAKQSERAAEMRRVHMSTVGYVCVAHTPTGEKVGINKQMAIFAFISPPTSSEALKKVLLEDPDVIKLNEVKSPQIIAREHLGRIFVNGYHLGYVRDIIDMAKKYRDLRRDLKINHYTTIFWDIQTNEIHFFVDIGRITRPLIIVYNMKRDPEMFGNSVPKKESKWEQTTAITEEDIQLLYEKKKTAEDLLRERKIEYITPEEQENCYVCPNFKQFKEHRFDETKQYTHLDIEQAVVGLTALTSPFANHNQNTRTIYQTSQCQQTGGVYSLNWPYRMDKEVFLQHINQRALNPTLGGRYIFSNGLNVQVAIMCYSGFNQEDSLIFNAAAIKRGMFYGFKRSYVKADSKQKEEIGMPDVNVTDGIKTANYSKLKDGVVPKGTHLEDEDVVIGRYVPITKGKEGSYKYVDNSIVYKEGEMGVVHDSFKERNEDDELFAKVSYRKPRELEVGDKLSSRAGQKGICALLMREADMPFNREGVRPTIIFNPHGMPTRMTAGQLIESMLSKVCAIKGSYHDATIFKEININDIGDALESYGYERYGNERLISGLTGELISAPIFIGPTYYQRLQHFVADKEYSVCRALFDAVTRQPLEGMSSFGGLKIGEMEQGVLASHGASTFFSEKFYQHSDGFLEYVCRCGLPAVVNVHQNIYKCKRCKDNADICAIPTSWSAKLFHQEVQSLGVSVMRMPVPYRKEIFNYEDDHKEYTAYSGDVVNKLVKYLIDNIDDMNKASDVVKDNISH